MGFNIQKSDIEKLLQDKKLMKAIIKKVVNNPKSMGGLVKDLTKKLVDVLQDSPEFKKKVMAAAGTLKNGLSYDWQRMVTKFNKGEAS